MIRSIWSRKSTYTLISTGGLVFFLGMWKIFSVSLGADIILPPPEKVFFRFAGLIGGLPFYRALWDSFLRGMYSFILALVCGLVLGVGAGINDKVHAALKPFIEIIKTTPVMSVILIALIWFKSGTVPVFSAFLMAFPVIFQNVYGGIRQSDRKLLEMGKTYNIPSSLSILHISIPSVVPHLVSGARTALGLTWKVVVAAEVLSLPRHGIGTGLQYAQMTLETAEVFAWTAAAVILNACTQLLLSLAIRTIPWNGHYGYQA